MKTMTLTAILWAAIASGVAAQFSATIGVTGTTLAGTTFTLRLQASPTYTRDIDFSGLTTDHSALAMASLMTAKINTDYRKNENTGFQAENPMKADGKSKFDATFELHCTVPITDVLVGALGNPTTGIPRPPGVAQNPNIFNFQSSHGLFPFQGAQVGQTNANMTVDAIDPALDFRRRIEHVIGEPFTLQISSGPNGNAGFFLLAGPLFHGALMLPITGDFIDLGIPTGPASAPLGISVLGDGISSLTGSLWDSLFRTDGAGAFTLSLGNTGGLGRFNVGLQAGVADPTVLFGFRMTQAADVYFDQGQHSVLPVSSDGVVPMNFSVGAMPFYGSVRNGLFAHENGFITFGAPSSLGVASMIDPNAANMSEPAVLVNWANWDLAGTPGIEIYEFGREVRIGWGTAGAAVRHFNDSDQARFECVMIKGNSTGAGDDNAGAIMLDIIQLDAAALNQNGAVVGVTGGMGLDPTPSSRDLGLRQFASGPNGALFGQATLPSLALSVLNVASGGPGLYRNGSGLSGRKLVFLPPSGGGPLGNRPFSIGTRANPDDVASLIGSASLSAAGATTGFPQTLRLLGYFQFLIGTSPLIMPRVFLDPFGAAGVGPVALSIDSIMDSTGFFQGTQPGLNVVPPLPGFRDFEGLSVQLDGPILPVPPAGVVVDLQVVFDNGTTFLLPQAVTINP